MEARGLAWLAVTLVLMGTNPAWAEDTSMDFARSADCVWSEQEIEREDGYLYVTCGLDSEPEGLIAVDRWEVLDEDSSVEIRLEGTRMKAGTLKYWLVELPRHGRLSGTAPFLVYTPHPDFHGQDTLTFRVSDGETESSSATVFLTVREVNDAPVAMSRRVTVSEGGSVQLELEGRDAEGDTLAFELLEGPTQGALTIQWPHVEYQPRAGASREDSFTFAVSDGEHTTCATVTLNILPAKHAPIARDTRLKLKAGERRAFVLHARDANQDALTYAVSTRPGSGELSGDAPALTYQAEPDFGGEVSFTFTVTDVTGLTSTGTVRIQVEKADMPVSAAEFQVGAFHCGAAPGSVTPLVLACVALCLLAHRQPRLARTKALVTAPSRACGPGHIEAM